MFPLPLLVAGCLSVASERPNIVVIYADDHAERAVGACGSPFARTPHIDSLATDGLRFRQSFVANSICGPARATFLTGLHSHANGKTTNGGGFRDDLPVVSELLQEAGYRTAVVGKWHLQADPRGFDHWAIARGGYYNPSFVTVDGASARTGYTTELITDEALRWIAGATEEVDSEGARGAPFFCWISHAATHRTWMPSPQHLSLYDDVEIPEPASLFDDYRGRSSAAAAAQMRIARDLFPAYDLKLPVTGDGILDDAAARFLEQMTADQRDAWTSAYGPKNEAFAELGLEGDELVRWKYQRYLRDYLRCVAALDDAVGRVLAFLDEAGLAEDTVVIYTSDQGFFLGEHGWYDKRWIYEPSLRTPFLVRWPGVARPGAVRDELVQNIDLAPTFLDLAGVAEPPPMHGRSLVPLLRGEAAPWRDAIYYHYHQRDSGRTAHTVAPHYGIRTERYKLVHVYGADDEANWELYDLEQDPDELVNRIDRPDQTTTVQRLRGRLVELRRECGDVDGQ